MKSTTPFWRMSPCTRSTCPAIPSRSCRNCSRASPSCDWGPDPPMRRRSCRMHSSGTSTGTTSTTSGSRLPSSPPSPAPPIPATSTRSSPALLPFSRPCSPVREPRFLPFPIHKVLISFFLPSQSCPRRCKKNSAASPTPQTLPKQTVLTRKCQARDGLRLSSILSSSPFPPLSCFLPVLNPLVVSLFTIAV
ncbi:hypothetical protein BDW42DRAFT_51424 [Aspergillus taichungensis]|uniref:Uncharacterized protein n=1 Tax=Aspergillus taichungensis TaxID=482145 RepID=A0A2J5HDH8_9EURO|nr:hypothetical protein BDW42DRAFT_51424 [Aspergillus taichungensis]